MSREINPRRSEFNPDMLISSKRVLNKLVGDVKLDTIGYMHGSIDDIATSHPRFSKVIIAEVESSPITSEDVRNCSETLQILEHDGSLPEDFDRDDMHDALKVLGGHLQADEKLKEEQKKHRRKVARTTATAAAVTTLIVGGSAAAGAAGGWFTKTLKDNHQAYDTSHQLTEMPSAPSYNGWRVEATSPHQEFVPNGGFTVVGNKDSVTIQQGNELTDTGIELRFYETAKGEGAIQLWIPTEDPHAGRLDDSREYDMYIDRDEKLLPDTSEVVLFTDSTGKEIPLLIEDTKPSSANTHSFTVTPVHEVLPER